MSPNGTASGFHEYDDYIHECLGLERSILNHVNSIYARFTRSVEETEE